ncbi:MAG: hypothetical protein AB7G08_31795 [Hyphomicrobiaceae bacterium]
MHIFEHRRHANNAREVAAHANYLRARADQADACLALVKKRRELLLEIASLRDLPDEIAHRRELGRLNRLNELRLAQLQHDLSETNAKIEVAIAQARLAAALPLPEREVERPVAAAPPAPQLSAADIRKAAEMMPELENKPEAIDTLVLVLTGMLAEKRT